MNSVGRSQRRLRGWIGTDRRLIRRTFRRFQTRLERGNARGFCAHRGNLRRDVGFGGNIAHGGHLTRIRAHGWIEARMRTCGRRLARHSTQRRCATWIRALGWLVAVLFLGGRLGWRWRRKRRQRWSKGWHAASINHQYLPKGSCRFSGVLLSLFANIGQNEIFVEAIPVDSIDVDEVHVVVHHKGISQGVGLSGSEWGGGILVVGLEKAKRLCRHKG